MHLANNTNIPRLPIAHGEMQISEKDGKKSYTQVFEAKDGQKFAVTLTYPSKSNVQDAQAKAEMIARIDKIVHLAAELGLGKEGGPEKLQIDKSKVLGFWKEDGRTVEKDIKKTLEQEKIALKNDLSLEAVSKLQRIERQLNLIAEITGLFSKTIQPPQEQKQQAQPEPLPPNIAQIQLVQPQQRPQPSVVQPQQRPQPKVQPNPPRKPVQAAENAAQVEPNEKINLVNNLRVKYSLLELEEANLNAELFFKLANINPFTDENYSKCLNENEQLTKSIEKVTEEKTSTSKSINEARNKLTTNDEQTKTTEFNRKIISIKEPISKEVQKITEDVRNKAHDCAMRGSDINSEHWKDYNNRMNKCPPFTEGQYERIKSELSRCQTEIQARANPQAPIQT